MTGRQDQFPQSASAADAAIARSVGIVGLLGLALIHLLDSVSTYHETRYLFWMYVALMGTCVLLAGVLLVGESRLAWAAAGALAASVLGGYVLSRTVGLPNATDDIGNWTDPLGLASLFVEGCLAGLAAVRVAVLQAAAAPVRRGVAASAVWGISGRPAVARGRD